MQQILFISLALLKRRKKHIILAILGVALGVTALIVSSSLMRGFEKYFIRQVIELEPHIVIKPRESFPKEMSIQDDEGEKVLEVKGYKPKEKNRIVTWREIKVALEGEREVVGIAPRLEAKGIIKLGGKEKAVSLIGIEPEEEKRASSLEQFLSSGNLLDIRDNKDGLFIGVVLAKELGIEEVGQKVLLYLPGQEGRLFRVFGFFDSGITSIDSTRVILSREALETLLNRGDEVNLIVIRVKDPYKAKDIASFFEARLGEKFTIEPWQDAYKNFLRLLKTQNTMTLMIVIIILMVSAFGIYNIIMMTVVEKRKEIAILMAMGYKGSDILGIFLSIGFFIALVGSLIGFILSFFLIGYLETLDYRIEGTIRAKGFLMDKSFKYYIEGLLFSYIFCLLASIYPAYKASRVNPVDILRNQ
ncbi:MAG: ABC transporter permease [Caldimicrobium sp.]|nr:ABC transporter permease [Caldimicrobium sp.]MDW8182695.1 ABC transporter permease [Caldimicrobium sp.]